MPRISMTLNEYDNATLALEDAAVLIKSALELSHHGPNDLPMLLVGQADDRIGNAREILLASQGDKSSPGNG